MKKVFSFSLIVVLCGGWLFSQTGGSRLISFEFVDQNIREILYAFSTYSRLSIIADDTVTGNASFQ